MKRLLVSILPLTLAACGTQNVCQEEQTEQLVLNEIKLLTEHRVAGNVDRDGFTSSLSRTSLTNEQPDRVVCEASLNIAAALTDFRNYFFDIDDLDPFDWAAVVRSIDIDNDEKWQLGLETIYEGNLREEFTGDKLNLRVPVSFSLSVDEEGNAGQLIAIEEKNRSNSILHQVVSAFYTQAKQQLTYDNEQAELERLAEEQAYEEESYALGFSDVETRREVEAAIKVAQANLENIRNSLSSVETIIREVNTQVKPLHEDLRALSAENDQLRVDAEQFENLLKSQYFTAENELVELTIVEQTTGSFSRPVLRLEVTNKSNALLSSLTLSGIIWSDETGEVKIEQRSAFLGRDGLQPGETTTATMELTERMGSGPLGTPAFRSAKKTGGWLYITEFRDGMRNRHSAVPPMDPRVTWRQVQGQISSIEQNIQRLNERRSQALQRHAPLTIALREAERLLEEAQSRMPSGS